MDSKSKQGKALRPPVNIVIEAPDGQLHGTGVVVASADAYRIRPKDVAPKLRALLFSQRG